MTDPTLQQLQTDADKISTTSTNIRRFAQDTVAYLRATSPAPTPTPTPTPAPTPAPADSYEAATAWARTDMLPGWAPFTKTATVHVSSAAALKSACAAAKGGELIICDGPFDVAGEWFFTYQPASPVEVDCSGVTFTGNGGSQLPCVWWNGCSNFYFYGGTMKNPNLTTGGNGIIAYNPKNMRWWDLDIRNCAGGGIAIEGKTRPCSVDLRLKGGMTGLSLANDPHPEAGTGTHFMYLGGGTDGPYPISGRIAVDLDHQKYGAGVEVNHVSAMKFYGRGDYLGYSTDGSFFDAAIQVAGNLFQVWGDHPSGSHLQFDVEYAECHNSRGRPFDTNGLYGDLKTANALSGSSIVKGRATNCCQNPHLSNTESPIPANEYWDRRGGIRLVDVVPAQ